MASSRGQVYYWTGCDNWHSIRTENLRWFETAAEAEASGYRPSTARGCVAPELRTGDGPSRTGICTVERVVDGDTILCEEASERIRLLLIDTPELAQTPHGESARRALEAILPPGTEASIELDVQERDRNGRILAYVYTPSGEMANEYLAARGFAVTLVYPPNVKYVDRIRSAVDAARRNGVGLWNEDVFGCMPVDFRGGRCQ